MIILFAVLREGARGRQDARIMALRKGRHPLRCGPNMSDVVPFLYAVLPFLHPTSMPLQDPAALVDLKKQRIRVDLDLPSNAMSSRLKTACQGSSYPDGSRTARLSEDGRDRTVGGRGQAGGVARRGGSDDEGAGVLRGSKRGRKGRAGDRGGDSGADGVPQVS